MLTKKALAGAGRGSRFTQQALSHLGKTMDRRTFLKRSGLAAGSVAFASQLPFSMIKKASAAEGGAGTGAIEVKRTVCTHCSVGCSIDAEVQDGVWIGQEPVFDSPINLGTHCAKGASVREHGHGEGRHSPFYGQE